MAVLLTDENGTTTIKITAKQESGMNEGYLDVTVKAPCHETFSQQNMIKIIQN